MFVEKADKIELLAHLLNDHANHKTLVFVEMKHVANKIAKKLEAKGIKASAIHGNKSQSARQKAIQDFTNGDIDVLVATDIASRGIDIDGITHVINFELSNIAESYVHRIGRTARAGSEGIAISLVTGDEKSYLANVEKVTKQSIPVNSDHPYHSDEAQNAMVMKVGKAKKKLENQRRTEAKTGKRRSFKKKPDDASSSKGNKKFRSKNKSRSKKKTSASGDLKDKKSDSRHDKKKTKRSSKNNPKRDESQAPKKPKAKRSFFGFGPKIKD
jgi:ATP-dependent RNA helicase RhlE